MATWVGIFVNNLDGNLLRELEVEADDEVTAITLLDLYDYDETWQHYSFVDVQKKNVREFSQRNSRLLKEQKEPIGVPLIHADIQSLLATLICVHSFSCLCLCKAPFYYGQPPEFIRSRVQVHCEDGTRSKPKENIGQQALQWLAIAD